MMKNPRHILVTGAPGCGKTTLLIRLARQVGDVVPAGFYTGEIREAGVRKGFGLTAFDGRQGILAHVRFQGGPRVGRYGVDVPGFERFLAGIDLIDQASPLVLLDEIGKMECLSPRFVALVRELLDSGKTVVATVALKGGGLIAEVKGRPDCEQVHLIQENREKMPVDLAERLRKKLPA